MRILIVDDDPVKAEFIKKSLLFTKAEIIIVNNGIDAMYELLCEYDFLVSDMEFPYRDTLVSDAGLLLQKEMKASEIKTKTIFCSSLHHGPIYHEAMKLENVIGYIVYQGKDLENKFKNYIN